jgi:molybdenum cofactor cytidylyltransferase
MIRGKCDVRACLCSAVKSQFNCPESKPPKRLNQGTIFLQGTSILCPSQPFVIQLAAMETGTEKLPVAAIVLAAGGSTRMGQPKQLLPIDDQPMVRHLTEIVADSGLEQVIVVTGANARAVEAALIGLPVDLARSESWSEGMSCSMRSGLRALRSEVQAVLIVLGDQPGLTAALLQSLVARYQATRAPIVAPVYRGRRGNPVLFDRALFPELLAVQGDRGGRALIDRYQDRMEQVEVDDPAVVMDIDSPRDYHGLLGAVG